MSRFSCFKKIPTSNGRFILLLFLIFTFSFSYINITEAKEIVIGTGSDLIGVGGNSNSLYKLNVAGLINSTGLCLSGDCKSTWSEIVASGGGNQWVTSGSNIYNSNSGNIGIGTNNPTAKLQIENVGNIFNFRVPTSYYGSAADIMIGAFGFNNKANNYGYTKAFAFRTSKTNAIAAPSDVKFHIDLLREYSFITSTDSSILTAAKVTAFTIDGDGNVGIGTLTPAQKLDVVGAAQFSQPIIVGSPTATNHATTKSYVDSAAMSAANSFWTLNGINIYNSNSGSVGIGTNNPAMKLDVQGSANIKNVLRAGNYRHVLSSGFTSTAANGYLLTTAIPYDGVTNRGMHTIRIQGFAYGNNQPIDFVVNFYLYSSGFSTYAWTNYGAYNPGTVKLSYEGNVLKVWWSNVVYYPSFEVFTTSWIGSVDTNSHFEGWTITDTAAPATNVVDVPYANINPKGITMNGNMLLNGNWLSGDGGNEGVFVKSDGYVGIGKSNPAHPLDVTGYIQSSQGYKFAGSTNGQFTISAGNTYFDYEGGFNFRALPSYGSSLMLLNNGNVGIGTTTPGYKLDVAGTAQFTQPIIVGSPTIGGHAATKSYVDSTAMSAANSFWTANGSNIYNSNSGNVGIGTSTALAKLHVSAGQFKDVYIGNPSAIGVADLATLGGGVMFTRTNLQHADSGIAAYTATGGENNLLIKARSDVVFVSGNLNDERMRIKELGNVGIGTVIPGELLHISKSAPADDVTAFIENTGYTTGASTRLLFSTKGTDGNAYQSSIINKQIGATAGSLVFNTVGSDRMIISSTGNVGVGTTNPVYKMHIVGTGVNPITMIEGTSHTLGLKGLTPYAEYFNTSGTRLGWFGYGLDANDFYFANEVANKPIYFSTNGYSNIRMTIDGVGNVGIGTTTPAYKLDVAGTAQFSQPVIVGAPTAANHATTKSYVDSAAMSAANSFWAANGNNIYNSNSGNVGIGTTTPGQKLEVLGSALFNVGTGMISVANSSGYTGIYADSIYNSSGFNLTYWNGSSVVSGIKLVGPSGKVGIGTTNPLNRMVTSGTDTNSDLNLSTVTDASLQVSNSDTSYGTFFGSLSSGNGIVQQRRQDSAVYYDLKLQPYGGNVGIGTTDPGLYKLDVAGDIRSSGNLTEKKVVFTPTSVGWYRITSANGPFNANQGGMVRIYSGYDNVVTDVELHYNIGGYGTNGSIQQTRYSSYNAGAVSQARISSDGGGNSYLDIYISTATTPGPVTIYGYGFNMPNFVSSPVVGAVAGGTSLNTLTLGPGFRTTAGSIFAQTSGNVGIGLAAPVYKLDVSGTAQFNQPVVIGSPTATNHATTKSYVDSAISGIGVGSGTSGQTLRHNGTSWVANSVLYNNGSSIGIGTTNSGSIVEVKGDGNGYNGLTIGNNDPISWRDSSNNLRRLNLLTSGNALFVGPVDAGWGANTMLSAGTDLNFRVNGSTGAFNTAMFIGANGNVGVGTTNPVGDLSVANPAGGTLSITTRRVAGTTIAPLYSTLDFLGYLDKNSARIKASDETGMTWGSRLSFLVNNGSGPTGLVERMTILEGGNVGIDTTTPAYKLDVAGTAQFTQSVIVGTPTAAGHATTKSYVDSAAMSAANTFWTASGNNIYNSNSGNIGVGTTNPVQKLEINGDGARLRLSTVGSPSTYYFDIQSNYSAADTVNFYGAGGSNILKWIYNTNSLSLQPAGGNVGIGTTNPSGKLEIAGSFANSILTGDNVIIRKPNYSGGGWARTLLDFQEYTGASLYQIGAYGNNNTFIHGYIGTAYNDTLMRWYPNKDVAFDGNVGIGTTIPAYKLDVVGTSQFSQPVIVGAPTATNHATTKSYVDSLVSASNSFWTANGSNIYNSNSGNIGIGTSQPQNKLHVVTSASDISWSGVLNNENNLGSTGWGVGIKLKNATYVTGTESNKWGGMAAVADANWSNSTALAFYSSSEASSAAPTEKVRITGAGNVGIGITNPAAPLQVNSTSLRSTTQTGTLAISDSANQAKLLIFGFDNTLNSGNGAGFISSIYQNNAWLPTLINPNGGYVGIGVANPESPLDVRAESSAATTLEMGPNAFQIETGKATDDQIMYMGNDKTNNLSYIQSVRYGIEVSNLLLNARGGNVGIGTTTPSFRLTVAGDAYTTSITSGQFKYESDRNLKKNIATIKNPLEKIQQLRGVTFDWKRDNRASVGLIAQEVEKVFPELVANGKSVEYGNLVAPLIEAVKEQQKEIESLNKRIIILENRK